MTRTRMTLTTFPIATQNSGARLYILVDLERHRPLLLRTPFNLAVAQSLTSIPLSPSQLEQS
jgi:hypothetical protein